LFGLWHIVPTVRTLDANGVVRGRAVGVAGAVAVTAVVGLFLWEVRVATGGLLAPALVHAAANSGATVAAYRVLRSTQVAPADPLPDVAAEKGEEHPT
jgi:membrane protease YdiL (CAAX protease family)